MQAIEVLRNNRQIGAAQQSLPDALIQAFQKRCFEKGLSNADKIFDNLTHLLHYLCL